MKIWYHSIQFLAKVVFKIIYHVKIYGLEHIPEGGAIIAPNHSSYYDPPIIAGTWPGEVHFLATEYLFKVPILGFVIRRLNSHPVHRGAADLGSIRLICNLLKGGAKVIVFPEGGRSKDGKIGHLKPGIAMILARANASVIPVYIHGNFQIWPPYRKYPKLRGKTAVVYGKSIRLEECASLDKREQQHRLINKLQQSLYQLEAWYLEGAKGTPP